MHDREGMRRNVALGRLRLQPGEDLAGFIFLSAARQRSTQHDTSAKTGAGTE